MSFTSIISLFALVIGCSGSDDPKPNKDAPDLDFSKAQWVNEYGYDGVFTTTRDISDNFIADFSFNGATAKKFNPKNSKNPIENGIWFEPSMHEYFGKNVLKSYKTTIIGVVDLNGISFSSTNFLGKIFSNDAFKFNPEEGLTWKVLKVNIPDTEEMKKINGLSPGDAKSFQVAKEKVKVFPEPIRLESKYTLGQDQKELMIDILPLKEADLIYVKFTNENSFFFTSPSSDDSGGFLKFYKGDVDHININKSELKNYVSGPGDITMTVTALKFYTSENGNRKFLFKNTSESVSKIILE